MSKTHGLTLEELQELSKRATAAKDVSYCPYSNFRVGCALLCDDGSWVIGANVENASYPVTICAERTALVKAITEGKKKFRAIGVSTDISPPASPCGMCRQFIREFSDNSVPIFMYGKEEGECVVRTLGELLPMSFGPEDLLPPGRGARK
ncbi:cytidine deaminase-like protein [Tuber borchii]|uniref:Cytidine deaminase n=1 Tax=Tuber borchii TaxID=42251 RepID=A0A2T6ZLL8_TUBBO|nr:cytidine deaminase-like protein [Tuber borchii]